MMAGAQPRSAYPAGPTDILEEAFGQLWDYEREAWARRFFDNWRASLKWQRIETYELFADLIDRQWDGIAADCKPENKVSLGFVEGLNNKIRVFQRRHTDYATKNMSASRFSLACFRPQNHPLDSLKTHFLFPDRSSARCGAVPCPKPEAMRQR
jgi:Transposase